MRSNYIIALILIIVGSGCADNKSSPLLFGQGVTVGISAGAAPEAGGSPQITVGVRQANIAVVPTVVPNEVDVASADRRIAAFGADQAGGRAGKTDALSTFGSFSSTSAVGVGDARVQLGIFFATGVAAQTLSEGFRCALASIEEQKAGTITITEIQGGAGS